MTKITYTPLENGDPIETSFGGFNFIAGKAVDIPDSATIDIIERKVTIDAEGNEKGRGVARKIKISEHLRGNPYFHVDGTKQATAPSKNTKQRVPKSPEEYRSFALAWFATCQTPDELKQRWDNEAELRDRISVHEDGEVVRYLRPFYEARFEDLSKAAA